MLDHDALFAEVAAGLRPGGRLVAQCGGGDDPPFELDGWRLNVAARRA